MTATPANDCDAFEIDFFWKPPVGSKFIQYLSAFDVDVQMHCFVCQVAGQAKQSAPLVFSSLAVTTN